MTINPTKYKKYIPKTIEELDMTDINSIVFKDDKNKEIVIAMRGIDKTDYDDLKMIGDLITADTLNTGGANFDYSIFSYIVVVSIEEYYKIFLCKN